MLADKINVTLADSGVVTLFSMAIVFVALLVISYSIDLMRICIEKRTKKPEAKAVVQTSTEVVQPVVDEDDTELVAVITAAIAAMTGTSSNGLVVKNIKRLPDMDSAWSKTGKIELMR